MHSFGIPRGPTANRTGAIQCLRRRHLEHIVLDKSWRHAGGGGNICSTRRDTTLLAVPISHLAGQTKSNIECCWFQTLEPFSSSALAAPDGRVGQQISTQGFWAPALELQTGESGRRGQATLRWYYRSRGVGTLSRTRSQQPPRYVTAEADGCITGLLTTVPFSPGLSGLKACHAVSTWSKREQK